MNHNVTEQHCADVLRVFCLNNNITPVIAVESGSRAWGFPSPDSDFDVRVIYARPARAYFRLNGVSDNISYMTDDKIIDIAAWDIRKALALLIRGNFTVREWINSPFAYDISDIEPPRYYFQRELRDIADSLPARKAGFKHYGSFGRQVYLKYLSPEIHGAKVNIKKYLYALRPALAIRWFADNNGCPPVDIYNLMRGVELSTLERDTITQLLESKKLSGEMGVATRIPVIDSLVQNAFDFAWHMLDKLPNDDVPDVIRERCDDLIFNFCMYPKDS